VVPPRNDGPPGGGGGGEGSNGDDGRRGDWTDDGTTRTTVIGAPASRPMRGRHPTTKTAGAATTAAAALMVAAVVAVTAAPLWTTASAATLTRVVQTRYGKLQGVVRTVDVTGTAGGTVVDTFLGVPYATPPVGSNRFGPTRTPSPWDGVRLADVPGPVCPQRLPDVSDETAALKTMARGRVQYLRRLLPYLQNQSEDCLYLNVYAPAQGEISFGGPVKRVFGRENVGITVENVGRDGVPSTWMGL